MLLHKNGQFIHDRVAFRLPNNLCLDTEPVLSGGEHLEMLSMDKTIKLLLSFEKTNQNPRTLLEEVFNDKEEGVTVIIHTPVHPLVAGGLAGYHLRYQINYQSDKRGIVATCHDEYVFAVPGDEPGVFEILLEAEINSGSFNVAEYNRICEDVVAGIHLV